jgi:hypothetical protein
MTPTAEHILKLYAEHKLDLDDYWCKYAFDMAVQERDLGPDGEAIQLLRDYFAAYPFGRLGERAREILGESIATIPCATHSSMKGEQHG